MHFFCLFLQKWHKLFIHCRIIFLSFSFLDSIVIFAISSCSFVWERSGCFDWWNHLSNCHMFNVMQTATYFTFPHIRAVTYCNRSRKKTIRLKWYFYGFWTSESTKTMFVVFCCTRKNKLILMAPWLSTSMSDGR